MGKSRLPVVAGAVVVAGVVEAVLVVESLGFVVWEVVVVLAVAGSSAGGDDDDDVVDAFADPVGGEASSSAVPHPTANTMDAAPTTASVIGWWCFRIMMCRTARSGMARNDASRVLEASNGAHSIAWP